MIFLVTIPHQTPASIACFSDEAEVIRVACEESESSVTVEYPETFDDALTILTDDMHGHIVVRRMDEVDLVGEYAGHQKYKVRAMAGVIENMLLLDY